MSQCNATVNTLSHRMLDHVEDIEEYTIPKSMLSKSSKKSKIDKNEISKDKFSPRSNQDAQMSVNSQQ